MDPGIFELKTETDLLLKLETDLAAARNDPLNSCIWFNFFLTAHHLPEWHFKNEDKAKDFRKRHYLTRICWEIANGGKHYQLKPKPNNAIGGTNLAVVIGPDSTLQKEFIILLTPNEANKLGKDALRVVELAEMIVEYFKSDPY